MTISTARSHTVGTPEDHFRRSIALFREPLLHFVLIGALLFGIDSMLVRQKNDPRLIVVDATVDAQARSLFNATRGRDPTPEELVALRRVWLDNEVLYREGLAMRLDRGDDMIRERVIFKALSVVNANLKPPAYDDGVLRAWFEANRKKYDVPARLDFQEAVLTGESSEVAIRDFVRTLNTGTPGDVDAGLRVFKGRPYETIAQSYGEEFAKALEQLPRERWSALPSRNGTWRAIKLEAISPANLADFENLRGVVLQDWTDSQMSELRTSAVRALEKKYKIRIEDAAQ